MNLTSRMDRNQHTFFFFQIQFKSLTDRITDSAFLTVPLSISISTNLFFIVSTFICLIAEGNSATSAIAGGVAAGVALLFAAPAIVFAWWRRRKPQEFFFDVPGELSHPIQLNTVLVE